MLIYPFYFSPAVVCFSNCMFVRYNLVLYAHKTSYPKGLPPLTPRLGLETANKNVILSGARLHKSLLIFINSCPHLHDNRISSQQRVDDTRQKKLESLCGFVMFDEDVLG